MTYFTAFAYQTILLFVFFTVCKVRINNYYPEDLHGPLGIFMLWVWFGPILLLRIHQDMPLLGVWYYIISFFSQRFF